jgi:hypothetical protein
MPQAGHVTLLVTSLLLILALVLTLASYRGTLFQIKQANNELEARQSHWIAEGGLECLYGQIKFQQGMPSSLAEIKKCGLSGLTLPLPAVLGQYHKLEAKQDKATLTRLVTVKEMEAGVLQVSSDLYIESSLNIKLADPGALTEKGWQCRVLRYKSDYTIKLGTSENAVNNSGVSAEAVNQVVGFDAQGKGCEYQNDGLTTKNTQDWKQDTEMDLFHEFFGISREEHNKVRDNGKFVVLGELTSSFTPQYMVSEPRECGGKIIEAIDAENQFLWVEGSCMIDTASLGVLGNKTKDKPITLVVHDGSLSLHGSGTLNGVLFQFNHAFEPSKADWDTHTSFYEDGTVDGKLEQEVSPYLFPSLSDRPAGLEAKTAYFQRGALEINGAMYIDSPGHGSITSNSLTLIFNEKSVKPALLALSKNYRWVKGSWQDFIQPAPASL